MKIRAAKSILAGTVSVPGSKSHTIRGVVVAMMAEGESTLRQPLVSGDTLSCLDAAKIMGAKVAELRDGGGLVWKITGVGGKLVAPAAVIDLGNSGTSLRLLAGLAATSKGKFRFDGDHSLRGRPMQILLTALQKLGARVTAAEGGKCPLSVTGPLRGGEATVEGKSSQFISSLLFALPLAAGDSELNVVDLNERPYVEITLDWLQSQGVEFQASADLATFTIKGGQRYHAFDRAIPADFSTATFAAAGAAVTGGEVSIRNLDFADRQGDKLVFEYFERMGMKVERGAALTTVRSQGPLQGVELDLNATPDALPAMAVAACFAEGHTALLNVPQARIKETDRIDVMTRELRALGADIEELPDGMVIKGGLLKGGGEVHGHDDHRVVMALAIAGLGLEGGVTVDSAEAAAVTYPDFVKDFQSLGGDIALL